jgi:hypothetical protein
VSDPMYVGFTLLLLGITYGLIVLCERLMEEPS